MIVSKSFCAVPWLCLWCFCLLSARFLIGYCFISRDNLQIIRTFVLGVPPHIRIYDRKYSTCPLTTGKSDKIMFRSTKVIGTLPRIIGRGEIGPKSARLSWCVPSIIWHTQFGSWIALLTSWWSESGVLNKGDIQNVQSSGSRNETWL